MIVTMQKKKNYNETIGKTRLHDHIESQYGFIFCTRNEFPDLFPKRIAHTHTACGQWWKCCAKNTHKNCEKRLECIWEFMVICFYVSSICSHAKDLEQMAVTNYTQCANTILEYMLPINSVQHSMHWLATFLIRSFSFFLFELYSNDGFFLINFLFTGECYFVLEIWSKRVEICEKKCQFVQGMIFK